MLGFDLSNVASLKVVLLLRSVSKSNSSTWARWVRGVSQSSTRLGTNGITNCMLLKLSKSSLASSRGKLLTISRRCWVKPKCFPAYGMPTSCNIVDAGLMPRWKWPNSLRMSQISMIRITRRTLSSCSRSTRKIRAGSSFSKDPRVSKRKGKYRIIIIIIGNLLNRTPPIISSAPTWPNTNKFEFTSSLTLESSPFKNMFTWGLSNAGKIRHRGKEWILKIIGSFSMLLKG